MKTVDNRSRWRRFTDFMMRLWYHFPLRKKTYHFPHMSRLAGSLVNRSPYHRHSWRHDVNSGRVRMIIKCNHMMSAEEAQLVLDESKVKPKG
jgi:hypothetical protein